MPTLTWLTRESDLKKAKQANFRILEKVSELSVDYPSQQENLIIEGDNRYPQRYRILPIIQRNLGRQISCWRKRTDSFIAFRTSSI